MFSGIVQACVPVAEIKKSPGLTSFALELPEKYSKNLKIGASIAVDGTCLTVTKIKNNKVFFDAMEETLQKTTLKHLSKNSRVNIERSLKAGDEIGGHLVSGHVTNTAEIVKIETPENNHIITFQVSPEGMPYIFPKGFITLDGCSLTIVDVDKEKNQFTVHFIPETLKITIFKSKKVGDQVNLEIDSRTQITVDTVQQYMQSTTAN